MKTIQPALTWLHVSDLHFGHGKDAHTRFDQEAVTDAIIADAKTVAKHLGAADLIIVTGARRQLEFVIDDN